MYPPNLKFLPVLLLALGMGCSQGTYEHAQDHRSAGDPLTATICGQEWMTRDLDVVTYRNGDAIPEVQDAAQWASLTFGAWCWYDNDPNTGCRLYNWYAVNDPRGLAPKGWHVPSEREWSALEACLGDSVGYRLRKAGKAHWPGPATGADNSSGFGAMPCGIRSVGGAFSDAGRMAVHWLATSGSESDAWCGRLVHHVNNKGVPQMVTGIGYMHKGDGYTVRCLRDSRP